MADQSTQHTPSSPSAAVISFAPAAKHDRMHQDRYSNDFNQISVDTDAAFNPVRGEQALWQAVITQALMDAASGSSKAEAQQDKMQAIRWLMGGSDDFISVCHHAGMDPEFVQQKVREALARNCRWRAEPGQGPKATKAEFPKHYETKSAVSASLLPPPPHTIILPQEKRA